MNGGQNKAHSLFESLANVAIGYFVALLSQIVVFPFYGIHIPLSSNLWIGAWFTAISIARSYALRRWFNRLTVRGAALTAFVQPTVATAGPQNNKRPCGGGSDGTTG